MSSASLGPDWSAWLDARQRALVDELQRRLGPGTPLPPAERAAFEGRLGFDLGAAVLHPAPIGRHLAQALGADAFTVGAHVVASQAAASGPGGAGLLAHELTHVVQHVSPAALPAGAQGSTVQRQISSGGESIAQRVETDVVAPAPTRATAASVDRVALAERVYRRLVDELRRAQELGSAWS